LTNGQAGAVAVLSDSSDSDKPPNHKGLWLQSIPRPESSVHPIKNSFPRGTGFETVDRLRCVAVHNGPPEVAIIFLSGQRRLFDDRGLRSAGVDFVAAGRGHLSHRPSALLRVVARFLAVGDKRCYDRATKSTLQATLLVGCRVGGRVRHEQVAALGPIKLPLTGRAPHRGRRGYTWSTGMGFEPVGLSNLVEEIPPRACRR
jgi:hypothetical protein